MNIVCTCDVGHGFTGFPASERFPLLVWSELGISSKLHPLRYCSRPTFSSSRTNKDSQHQPNVSYDIEAAAMSAIKPVTPDEAAAVWRSIPNPSARRVAKALTQAGRRVHFSTVARWRSEGWRPVSSGSHPIEAARQSLDVAARLLTGDPATGADEFVRQAKADEPL